MASSDSSTGRCLACKADNKKLKWSHCSRCRFDIAEKLEDEIGYEAAQNRMLVKVKADHIKHLAIQAGGFAALMSQEEVADKLLSETPETPEPAPVETPETPAETNTEVIAKAFNDTMTEDIKKQYPKVTKQIQAHADKSVKQAGSHSALVKKSCDDAQANLEKEETYGEIATRHGYHFDRVADMGHSGLGKTGKYQGAPKQKSSQCECRLWCQVQIKGKQGKFSYPNVRCKRAKAPGERMCSGCEKVYNKWDGERFFGFIQDPPPADPVVILDQPHRFLGSENYDDIQMPDPSTKFATRYFEGRDTLPWLDAYLTKTPMENPFFEKGGCLIDRTPDTSESDSNSDTGSE